MIKVCGHRILVQPKLLEETDAIYKQAKAFGLEIVREDRAREHESVDQGVVLQVGPTAWKDFGGEPWAAVGDTIVYAKFAGKLLVDPETKEKYIALNDEDVVAILSEKVE